MAYDPNDPSYSRLARTGTGQGPGSLVEKVMLASLNRAFSATAMFFKTVGSTKTQKAIKESTKLFKNIRKAGEVVGRLTETFRLTQTLLGMPTRTATQGLDMLGAQLVGPISGAISQSIGLLSASLNQILGPALQQIGAAVGGFVRANAMGAGIGGMIGGIAQKITGIPGLGLIGGLIGGGIEALYKMADEAGLTMASILPEIFENLPEAAIQFAQEDSIGEGGLTNIIPALIERIRPDLPALVDTPAGIISGDNMFGGGGLTTGVDEGIESMGLGGGAILTELQKMNLTLQRGLIE